MSRNRISLFAAAGATALLAVACSGPSPAHSATASANPPTPTATPTPQPTPDNDTVSVLDVAVGTFDLATIPVAELRNNAGGHGAMGVIVHFVTHASGGSNLGALDSVPVNLAPGETLAVTADCTDACNNAAGASATVTVAGWPTSSGITFTAGDSAYTCSPCRPGHGYGNVKGTLTPSSALDRGVAVVAFAVCRNGAGTMIGGGSAQLVWNGSRSLAVDVPVVVDAPPGSCALAASTGW